MQVWSFTKNKRLYSADFDNTHTHSLALSPSHNTNTDTEHRHRHRQSALCKCKRELCIVATGARVLGFASFSGTWDIWGRYRPREGELGGRKRSRCHQAAAAPAPHPTPTFGSCLTWTGVRCPSRGPPGKAPPMLLLRVL